MKLSFSKPAVWLCAAVAAFAADDRIRQPIDPNRTVPVRGQVHPLARPQFDQGPLDPSAQISYATMLLVPAPGLDGFLSEQQTPARRIIAAG